MKDVAHLAGVSTSTISHVINGNRYVSENVKKKVNAAIDDLNNTEGNVTRMLHGMETLLQKRVDGLLIMSSEHKLLSKGFLLRYPLVPIVTLIGLIPF